MMQQRLVELKDRFVESHPSLERPLLGYMRSALDEDSLARVESELAQASRQLGAEVSQADRDLAGTAPAGVNHPSLGGLRALEEVLVLESLLARQGGRLREQIPRLVNGLYRATVTLLPALLFSFLVLFDLKRLRDQVKSLRNSKLVDFYEEAAQPVVRFAYVVGRVLQAQALIALTNPALTTLGLLVLGIPSITMLALVVFLCSFVPVLGVFISTIPVVLVALNSGGFGSAITVVAVVVIVHAVEAYVLNPLIYGRQFKLNPVLVLFVPFAFGLAFEVPVAIVLLVWTELVTPAQLAGKRPYVVVGAFVVGAVITPPDVISQTLLAVPMWLLFELGVFVARAYFAGGSRGRTGHEAAAR